MPYRKKTLRLLPVETRNLAKKADYLETLAKSIKRSITYFAELEHDAQALHNHICLPFSWLAIESPDQSWTHHNIHYGKLPDGNEPPPVPFT